MAEPTYNNLVAAYSELRKAASQVKVYGLPQAMAVMKLVLQHQKTIDDYRTGESGGDDRRQSVSVACSEIERIARAIGAKRETSGLQGQFVAACGDLVIKIDEALF